MKYLFFPIFAFLLLFSSCDSEEASEYERTNAEFVDSLGGNISTQQWWRTAVKLVVNVSTDKPVKMWLMVSKSNQLLLCDYKEINSSGTVTMTAPQGQGDVLYLRYLYKNKISTKDITLTGKTEEFIQIETSSRQEVRTTRGSTPPESLCGYSIKGDAKYYQFTTEQLEDYFKMMNLLRNSVDAKKIAGLNCNYELESNGPFYITWVNGYEAEQRSRILGYYYHSSNTYDDIKYVDLSETHKWDYIDGLAKVQYQFNKDVEEDGFLFKANTWYDANFDMHDTYGISSPNNPDRAGDNAYNTLVIYKTHGDAISALRGISFKIDVPEGMRVGFYLRADEEPEPEQWSVLKNMGIQPYVSSPSQFMGTCFCAELMNTEGNGRGKHRSFVKKYDEVIWMGMEDLVAGGDHDCDDVIFGVVSDLKILMPKIVDPDLKEPDPEPDPELDVDYDGTMPWTIAFEDVNRNPDFDFNDCVIKVIPDYENERCCVWMMAAGSTSRMYLHYDGPDGDTNMGEIHKLFGSSNNQTYINTNVALANKGFVQIDCVPWPKGYTMANDAQRFYIEIQRGTCDDCTDVITLAQEPGKMPEALLVAGEWKWPMEGTNILSVYKDFSGWSRDATRMRFWEWYKEPDGDLYVDYDY